MASADYSEPSWCPEPASNLHLLLSRGAVHRSRLKAEEREGASGEERDRGARWMAEPAFTAGCANLLGKM